MTENLWLCLTCGFANCGRKQFGGIGGNGHALDHYKETGHMLGVKFGTITAEGTGGELSCRVETSGADRQTSTVMRVMMPRSTRSLRIT